MPREAMSLLQFHFAQDIWRASQVHSMGSREIVQQPTTTGKRSRPEATEPSGHGPATPTYHTAMLLRFWCTEEQRRPTTTRPFSSGFPSLGSLAWRR